MVSRGSVDLSFGGPSPDDKIEALGAQLDGALTAIAVLAGQAARERDQRRELEEVIGDIAAAGEVMAADLAAQGERVETLTTALEALMREGWA